MTNILTSIKNIHEARLIRDMSIGIVDVKNVDDGALGFVGVEEAEKIFNFLKTKTLSITMGDFLNPNIKLDEQTDIEHEAMIANFGSQTLPI